LATQSRRAPESHTFRDAGVSNQDARVGLRGGDDSPKVLQALRSFRGIEIVPAAADAATQVSGKTIREAIQISIGFDTAMESGQKSDITVEYYKSDLKSELALETTQKFFDDYRNKIVKEQLAARNLPAGLIDAFEVKEQDVAAEEKVGGSMFGGFVRDGAAAFRFVFGGDAGHRALRQELS
jgi:hypothetical protein